MSEDAGCPGEVCFEFIPAMKLLNYIGALEAYADEAYLRCGPRDAGL